MTLGFCTLCALDRPLAAVAESAAAAGFDGLEVTGRTPHLDPEASLEQVREAARQVRSAGLSVVAYGSYLGKDGPRDPAHAEREVARSEALGAPLLRVWAEAPPGDEGLVEIAGLLAAACDAARGAGITVVVERHVGGWADTPERIDRLFDAVDRPNFALNYQVLDFLPPNDVPAQPDDARRLAPRARYLHLKNYRPNPEPGGGLLLGGSLEEGVLDYRALLGAVLAAGYRGPMSVEFVAFDARPLEEKLAADCAWLRGLLGELAWDQPRTGG